MLVTDILKVGNYIIQLHDSAQDTTYASASSIKDKIFELLWSRQIRWFQVFYYYTLFH